MLIVLRFCNKVVTFNHLENQITWNTSWWRNKILHELPLPRHQMMVPIIYFKELTNSPGFFHPQVNMLFKAYFVPIWVFSNWYATLSLLLLDSYSQVVAYWFSYAFFLLWTSEAVNKEGKIKIGLPKQHQSDGAGNRKQLPEEANAFRANSTSKWVVSSS